VRDSVYCGGEVAGAECGSTHQTMNAAASGVVVTTNVRYGGPCIVDKTLGLATARARHR